MRLSAIRGHFVRPWKRLPVRATPRRGPSRRSVQGPTGHSVAAVAAERGLHPTTAFRIRQRYLAQGRAAPVRHGRVFPAPARRRGPGAARAA